MPLKLIHGIPADTGTERPVPRWALRAAYALPLLLLPSCLWRLPFAFHFEMGQVQGASLAPLWVTIPYVFGLSVLSETLALLCIGLVSRWGEVVPDRFPIIGGRRVPPMAAVVPATIGGLVLTAVSATMVLSWFGVTGGVAYENVWWETLAEACVAPLALWGPITLALTYAYYLRRRPAGRRDQRVAQASATAAGSQ